MIKLYFDSFKEGINFLVEFANAVFKSEGLKYGTIPYKDVMDMYKRHNGYYYKTHPFEDNERLLYFRDRKIEVNVNPDKTINKLVYVDITPDDLVKGDK